jgi:8-oxo-dGTP pyrophosphatase MutT (NUDIX family)
MAKVCDHTSVGVIIKNFDGKLALLKRAKFPVGIAPVAGHIDQHGSPQQAAIDEAEEELGLTIDPGDLQPTSITARRVDNQCRRENGTHHVWTVFEAEQFLGDLAPSTDETKGAGWYAPAQVQKLAGRTKARRAGKIADKEWEANPGLEKIWLDFLTELGYVT